jgi:prepilin-type N-terminal cleavage/methylation domain-containing protein
MRRGHTLLELAVVVAILGLLALVTVTASRAQVDRLAVGAAREEVAGLLREARGAARAHGGALVVVDRDAGVELRVRGDSLVRRVDPSTHGVAVSPVGSRTRAELAYGPSGLGRVASVTLAFTRGEVARTLVVSAHGRVRRD